MRTSMVAFIILVVISGMAILNSCKQEKAINPASCNIKTQSFVADVLPIIQSRCAIGQCHVAGGLAPFIATDYNMLSIVAGDGRLVKAIKHEGPFPMPRIDAMQPAADKLADSLIHTIECWVLQGFPNN